jgi:hypothetical protein
METSMHRLFCVLVLALPLATPARADRAVTAEEAARLVAATAALGCVGGKMEFDTDDEEFEVDDAKCADGRTYDLKFDKGLRLIRKELED